MAGATPFAHLFRQFGTDKDNPHQYGPVYDCLFPDRQRVCAVLELGVWQGYSLQAWRAAFPAAVVIGVDANPEHCPTVEGCEVYNGDQRDRARLLQIAGNRRFDLIVDDASHYAADQLISLFVLWPLLQPGGVYVIEEWDILPTCRGEGAEPWRGSFPLLSGCELIDTVDRNGVHEPLVVVRKAQA